VKSFLFRKHGNIFKLFLCNVGVDALKSYAAFDKAGQPQMDDVKIGFYICCAYSVRNEFVDDKNISGYCVYSFAVYCKGAVCVNEHTYFKVFVPVEIAHQKRRKFRFSYNNVSSGMFFDKHGITFL